MGKGLLVSQKAQEDPESRDERRNEYWVAEEFSPTHRSRAFPHNALQV
jgi:hypothetical protein